MFWNYLTLLFIALKLTNYIDWSWWLVLSPMLILISFILMLVIFYLILDFISRK